MSDEPPWPNAPDYDIWQHFEDAERYSGDQAMGPDDDDINTWAPIDLAPYYDGTRVKVATEVGMADAEALALLYPGKEHSILGEMESGKSWFCLASARAEILKGNQVIYIHSEESDPWPSLERLDDMDTPEELVKKYLRHVTPEAPATAAQFQSLLQFRSTLVILDGVNEAMALHGWGIRDEDGAATFRRRLVKPFIATGAATLQADHVVKDREQRGRTAIGSVHKVNAVTGAVFLMENVEPFGRKARGRSHLSVLKDRPGQLRSHGRPDRNIPGKTYLGELVVDDTRPPEQPWTHVALYPPKILAVEAPAPERSPQDIVLDAITALNDRGQVANVRSIQAEATLRKSITDDAITHLVLSGQVRESIGARNSRVFTVPGPPLSPSVP